MVTGGRGGSRRARASRYQRDGTWGNAVDQPCPLI